MRYADRRLVVDFFGFPIEEKKEITIIIIIIYETVLNLILTRKVIFSECYERAQSQNFIATWSTFSEKKNSYSATFLLGHLYSGDTTKLSPTIQEKGHLKPSRFNLQSGDT